MSIWGMPDSSSPSRTFRGQSRDERVQQRRQKLLDAGLATFGTQGFHATGVREICASAQLTERYFYESFKNREALFVAVYEQVVQEMHEAIGRALVDAPADLLEVSRRALRVVLTTFRDDPRVARLMLIEVLSAGTPDAWMKVSASFADLIVANALAVSPDLEKALDVRSVANGLYGSTVYIAMRWTLEGFARPLEEVLEHCLLFYAALVSLAVGVSGAPTGTPTETPTGSVGTSARPKRKEPMSAARKPASPRHEKSAVKAARKRAK